MINKWNFQTPSEEELHKRDQLVAELGFSPVICLLLVQRGITSIEEAKKFFTQLERFARPVPYAGYG